MFQSANERESLKTLNIHHRGTAYTEKRLKADNREGRQGAQNFYIFSLRLFAPFAENFKSVFSVCSVPLW